MFTKNDAYSLFSVVRDVDVYAFSGDTLFMLANMIFMLMRKMIIDDVDVAWVNVTFAILCVEMLRVAPEHFAVQDVRLDDVFRVKGRICYELSW